MAPRPATTDGSGRIRRSNSMGNLNVTGKSVNPMPTKSTPRPVVVKEPSANRRRPASAREQHTSKASNDEKATCQNKRPASSKVCNVRLFDK